LPGERLSFNLVLVGKIKDYLPYFIVTFKELSQAGFGRGRTAVDLAAVDYVGRDGASVSVYTRENNLVQPPASAISWTDLCGSHVSANGSMNLRPDVGSRADTQVGPYLSEETQMVLKCYPERSISLSLFMNARSCQSPPGFGLSCMIPQL